MHTHIYMCLCIFIDYAYTPLCVHAEYLLLADSGKNETFASHCQKREYSKMWKTHTHL